MTNAPPVAGPRGMFDMPPGAFRLLLAVAVVISHVSRLDIGRMAVLLFFYLSGYWTARIYAEKFGSRAVARFYFARYLRIAPLYLLAMLGAALLVGTWPRLANLTLLGVGSTHLDPTHVAWSLDVELQWYLLLPLVAGLLVWLPRWATALATAAAAVLGWYLHTALGIMTVAKYLPAFVLGALTFTRAWTPGARTANYSLLGFAAMTGVTALTPFLDKTAPDPFDQDIWGLLWMAPLLPYVAHSLTIRSTRLDRHLGNLSYPLYLVHFPVIAVVTAAVGKAAPGKLLAITAAVLVALALYFLVDRPVDRWRVRLTEGSPPA